MQDRSPPARRRLLQRTAGPYIWVNFEGVSDRTQLKVGTKMTVQYQEPQSGKSPLGFDITELVVE